MTSESRVNIHKTPIKFNYKSCPKCKSGTLIYSTAESNYHCVTCGWIQSCPNCLGDVVMNQADKLCLGCGSKTYMGQVRA